MSPVPAAAERNLKSAAGWGNGAFFLKGLDGGRWGQRPLPVDSREGVGDEEGEREEGRRWAVQGMGSK